MPNTYGTYNLSPSPTSGTGTFGQVPGQVGAPPSTWDQLNQNIPGFGDLTSTATGDIQSELAGQLSPQTLRSIQDYSAARGVSLGQPNSPLMNEIGMNLTGTTAEGLQNQGLQNYYSLTNTAGPQQQNPALLSSIAGENAVTGAAPNPQSASDYALQLYQQYMNPASGKTSFNYNPSGGGAGGGDNYSDFPAATNFGAGVSNFGYTAQPSPYTVFNTGGGNTGYYGSGGDNVNFGGF